MHVIYFYSFLYIKRLTRFTKWLIFFYIIIYKLKTELKPFAAPLQQKKKLKILTRFLPTVIQVSDVKKYKKSS